MPIAYDSSTNTITVTGFSESSPCTFEDLYQADQANGWGKISKPADHTYIVDCFIRVGNWSTETYFADENKQVNFRAEDFVSGNGDYIFRITPHAHVRFGKAINEEVKSSGNGCQFVIQNDVPYWLRFLFSDGQLELYSTSISLTNRHDIMGANTTYNYQNRIWNCIFQNNFHFSYTRNTDIFNLTVVNGSTFLRRPDETTTVNHCVGLSCSKGIWFQGVSGEVKDVYGRDMTLYAFRLDGLDENAPDCYIINGDLDSWTSRWYNVASERKVFRQYTLALKVLDEAGNPIEGASVVLKDKDGNIIFSEMTNADGEISEQTATYGYYQREGDGIFEHNEIFTSMSPHTLIVTKDGFREYKTMFELDRKIDWKIALAHADVNVDQEMLP